MNSFFPNNSGITRLCFGQSTAFLCGVATPRYIANLATFPISAIGKFELRRFPTFCGDNIAARIIGLSRMHRIAVVAHRHCENFIVGRSGTTNAPNYRSLMGRTKSIVLLIHVGDCTESDGKRERRKGDSQEKGVECGMDAIIVYVER